MGGYGSGRNGYVLKTLIEDCYPISVSTIKENIQWVDQNVDIFRGFINWSSGGKPGGSIGYKIKRQGLLIQVVLNYQTTDRFSKEKESFDYPIRIQSTIPNYGGKRYWFTCPLVIGGNFCNKRVGKLFLPPGGNYFGCRHCYELTYASSRDSHKWDNMWWDLGFDPSVEKMLKKSRKP